MILYYIRHGDPIYNPDSLTPLGERQAEAIGHRLAGRGIDRIYASTSARAQATARPTAEMTKKPVTLLDWCNESYAWEQMTVKNPDGSPRTWCFYDEQTLRLFCSEEVRALGMRWYEHPAFSGTEYGAGIRRIADASDSFFEELGYRHDRENHCYLPLQKNDERVALFAHQGFGLTFLSILLDIPFPLFTTGFDMTHTGMTVIEWIERMPGVVIPRVLELSADGHLYRDGLPTKYNNRVWI